MIAGPKNLNRMMPGRLLRNISAVSLLIATTSAMAQIDGYSASYAAEYRGRNVGDSVFSLSQGAQPGEYVFTSTTRARGLARLAAPRPVIDRSEFIVENGTIRPLRFSHEDGSRKGEDNHTIEFAADALTATVSGEGYTRELPLDAGVLDRGSLQAAMVIALRNGEELTQFNVLDEQSIDEYSFVLEGRSSVETPMGELQTLRYRQQRAGSSRFTLIDFAPSLSFVPAKIEQIRDGESQSAFLLESID